MLTAETKRRIDAGRDVLAGKSPLPTDQVELITLALIYKFMNSAKFQDGIKSRASRAVNQANISAAALAGYEIPLPPLEEQRRIVAELDAQAGQMEAVRGLIPRFEAKIQCALDRVWGNCTAAAP
jgi:type I restriction enzyme M protein